MKHSQNFSNPLPIEMIRHSTAHLMAAAILKLFPKTKFAIGPVVENGFYYDFEFKNPLTNDDLAKIEKEMADLISQNLVFEKKELTLMQTEKLFKKLKQTYKLELLKDIKKYGGTEIENSKIQMPNVKSNPKSKIQKIKTVTIYKLGDFIDLCRGPHLESTKEIKAFKLTKIAGAYWRGDEKNKMLTRIYGLAFEKQNELDEYLKTLQEIEKRDHRNIGKDLFLIDAKVGLGLPLWKPKGALLWRLIEDFWYKKHLENGYELVRSPHIASRELWETSGHWGFYSGNMFPVLEVGRSLEESSRKNYSSEFTGLREEYLLKPMNCPFHVQIYKSEPHSYRDLPIRWAECGTVYRYEKSGELSGLVRVRGFTQDDAHIICAKDQVENELKNVANFIKEYFDAFGFKNYKIYLSLRDPKDKKKYAGNDEGWNFTEKILEKVAQDLKIDYVKVLGEAAFYGPKLDYKIKDVLGREWQCATLQFDFNLPEKFKMTFINALGKEERPYMLHRALMGSFERFIGLLIEHYANAFPLWLAPEQIWILPIGSAHKQYAQQVYDKLKQNGFRIIIKDENETIGKKIRDGEKSKIPYLLVVGDKEINSDSVAVRQRGKGDLGAMKLENFLAQIKKENEEHK